MICAYGNAHNLLLAQHLSRLAHHVFHREAEVREQFFYWRRTPKIPARDHATIEPGVFLPPERSSRFDGNATPYLRRKQLVFILLRLLFEKLPSWHGNHAAADPLLSELLIGANAQLHFRACAHQDDLRRALAISQRARPASQGLPADIDPEAEWWQRWAAYKRLN